MTARLLALLLPCVFVGCSEYGYRYQPQPQNVASPISVDYRENGNTVDFLVATDGLRLGDLEVQKPDGALIKPVSIDYPEFKSELVQGVQDSIYGPEFAQGPTMAHFDKAQIGAGPWNVRVKVQAAPEETIRVGEGGRS